MRFIHCADLHLDSKMTSNLSREQAKERKMEILRTYSRMIDYAKENKIDGIIIAGDLFDTRNISATARNMVKDSIIRRLSFIILREIMTLIIFSRNWMIYRRICIFLMKNGRHMIVAVFHCLE